MPGDQIDRATVAVDGERHLGTDGPTAGSLEVTEHVLGELAVTAIHQAIEIPMP